MTKNTSLVFDRIACGKKGEELVAHLMEQRGWTILARNWKTRNGELDLVTFKENIVLFVEVKTRASQHFQLSQVITLAKQRSVVTAARQFMMERHLHSLEYIYRFDVALVYQNRLINYIPNAFSEQS